MLYPLSYRGGVPDGETRSYGRAVRPPMGTARRLSVSRHSGTTRYRHLHDLCRGDRRGDVLDNDMHHHWSTGTSWPSR